MSNNFTNESLAELGSNIKTRLTKAFEIPAIASDIEKNKMIQGIIICQLRILASIENKLGDSVHESVRLNDKFNEISKEKSQIESNYDLEDFNKVNDEVNWFKIYINNQYHLDIDSDQKIQVPDVSEIEDRNSNPLNTLNIGGLGGIFDTMPDQMADMAANMKLTNNIFAGKVYIYKTKPNIIPLIKKTYAVNNIIIGILLILTCVFSFCTIGVMGENIFDSLDIVTALLFSSILIYTGANSCRIQFTKKTRNENAIFYFDWRNPMIFHIFLGIGLIILSFNDFNSSDLTVFNLIISAANLHVGNGADLFFLYGLFASLTTVFVSFVVSVICLIIAGVNNPEKDKEKIQKLLSEYKNEFVKKNGKK